MSIEGMGVLHKLGDPVIDEQHQELCEIAIRLSDIRLHSKLDVVEELCRLMTYASMHFHSEEGLMSKIGYPGLHLHRLQHKLLETKLMSLAQPVQSTALPEIVTVSRFAEHWIANHLIQSDMDLRAHLLLSR